MLCQWVGNRTRCYCQQQGDKILKQRRYFGFHAGHPVLLVSIHTHTHTHTRLLWYQITTWTNSTLRPNLNGDATSRLTPRTLPQPCLVGLDLELLDQTLTHLYFMDPPQMYFPDHYLTCIYTTLTQPNPNPEYLCCHNSQDPDHLWPSH